MKETTYHAQEHKNHPQQLKIVHYYRHLFNRGFYKPMGISGDTLRGIAGYALKFKYTEEKSRT
jgi:hypothetical protein